VLQWLLHQFHLLPTGDTRVNFVGHGNDLSQEGAQSLADKVKILQQTYGNDSTNIKRIALVGCGTDGVNQSLTQDFAKAIYNDTPELKTANHLISSSILVTSCPEANSNTNKQG
jgi:hypothetical protein